jgi:hypothetical protein
MNRIEGIVPYITLDLAAGAVTELFSLMLLSPCRSRANMLCGRIGDAPHSNCPALPDKGGAACPDAADCGATGWLHQD